MKKINTVKEACKSNEVLRRKLYRRIKELKSSPIKSDFFGFQGKELWPVYNTEGGFLIHRGRFINLSFAIPSCKFTLSQIRDMKIKGFDI